jgi:hypothetical protein
MKTCAFQFLVACSIMAFVGRVPAQTLSGTQPLTMQGDLSAQMVAGIDKFIII